MNLPFPSHRIPSLAPGPSCRSRGQALLRLAAPSECGMLPVLFHQLWPTSLPSWCGGLSGFFVFERDSLNSKHSKFLAEAADRSCSAKALCLGLAFLWSLPDLPATVPKTSVMGYRSKYINRTANTLGSKRGQMLLMPAPMCGLKTDCLTYKPDTP